MAEGGEIRRPGDMYPDRRRKTLNNNEYIPGYENI